MAKFIDTKGWDAGLERGFNMGTGVIRGIEQCAEYIKYYKERLGMTCGVTSGGFDPIHPGHISCIMDSKERVDILFVVVNGDEFIRRKKKELEPFQPLIVRCQIVSAIKGVDCVVPFDASDPTDLTVSEALEILKPTAFLKGGDRNDIESLPETPICRKLGIQIITNMGNPKHWSSSDFLRKWDERKRRG
jgi:cytidyltransferase-like protein